MILDDEKIADLRPYDIRSFDGDADAPPDSLPPEGALLPVAPDKGFDPGKHQGAETGRESAFETESPEVEVSSGGTDFASIKYQRENTLLTNAERYADSIRGEAELYVRQLQGEVDALNAEAEKRYDEARRIKEAAEQEAARRIEEAEQRVEEVRAQAYREGFGQGRQDGLEKRYAEAGVYLENLESMLLHIATFRDHVDYYMERDGIRLAVLIAKKIIQQELKINKKIVWKLLAGTLSQLQGQGSCRIWLSPEDYEFAAAARPSLEKFADEDQALSFRSRADIPPGNAMIETDREVIDLSFSAQFHHVENLLYQALAEHEGNILNRPSLLGIPGWQPGQASRHPAETEPGEAETAEAETTEAEDDGAEAAAPADTETGVEPDPVAETESGEMEAAVESAPPSPIPIPEPHPAAMDVETAAAPPGGAPPPSDDERQDG